MSDVAVRAFLARRGIKEPTEEQYDRALMEMVAIDQEIASTERKWREQAIACGPKAGGHTEAGSLELPMPHDLHLRDHDQTKEVKSHGFAHSRR